ncbi:MAG: RDD family protein [Actinomycetota bacterium]
MSQEHTIVTPEAVVLDVDAAGLGSRLAANLLDLLIMVVAGVLLAIAGFFVDSTVGFVVVIGLIAFLPTIFGALTEGLWNGRSPGKSAVGLRVVQVSGQPITWKHAVVRNLFRLLDLWLWLGPIFMVLTKRSQRLGDLAAGTIVVREPKSVVPVPFGLPAEPVRDGLASRIDTSSLGPREYALLRDFLRRRWGMELAGRMALGRQLANLVWSNVALPPDDGLPDELLVEAAVVSVQARQASSPPAPVGDEAGGAAPAIGGGGSPLDTGGASPFDTGGASPLDTGGASAPDAGAGDLPAGDGPAEPPGGPDQPPAGP